MKHLSIILKRREGETEIRATMQAWYATSDWPERTEWSGERKEFALKSGALPTCLASLGQLESTVAHQAAQSGAAFEIIDHGGSAPMRMDNVLGPGEN